MIQQRLRRVNIAPEHWSVEVLGTGACVPGVLPAGPAPLEVVLRVMIRDARKAVVERFAKEFAPLVTSRTARRDGVIPPAGRRFAEVFAYWPAAGFQVRRFTQGDPDIVRACCKNGDRTFVNH